MKYFMLLFIAAVFFLTACASITSDIKVDANVAPKAKLSAYKTYDWLGDAKLLNDPNNVWQPPKFNVAENIKSLIESELNQYGILKSTSNPDLAVAFFTGVDMQAMELKEDPQSKIEILKNVPKAGMIVTLIDAETGYVVWLGAAEGNIQEGSSDEIVRKRLAYAVNQMFKLLPTQ